MWHLIDTSGKDTPGKISHHTSVVFGDKMYLLGGSKSSGVENVNMYSLDLKSFKWEIVNAVIVLIFIIILERINSSS